MLAQGQVLMLEISVYDVNGDDVNVTIQGVVNKLGKKTFFN